MLTIRTRRNHWLVFGLCLAALISVTAGAQVYVVPGGAGAQDGTSWANAYGNLADALSDGRAPSEDVWVAAGTYQPTEQLWWSAGVAGYGGFVGTETALDQRDWQANETILDGGGHRIFITDGTNIRVDGFTITNGGADQGGAVFLGGDVGIHIVNCLFENNQATNHAGAIAFWVTSNVSSALIENTVFSGNQAGTTSSDTGGAIVFVGAESTVSIVDCIFENNSAGHGGTISIWGCSPSLSIAQTLFANNSTKPGHWGGGLVMHVSVSEVNIVDTVFDGNDGGNGGAIAILAASPLLNIERTLFTGNHTGGLGGAFITHRAESPIEIANSVFVGNSADGGGNAFYDLFNTTTTTISYCSFAGNNGAGASVLQADGDPDGSAGPTLAINNSIVWGNIPDVIAHNPHNAQVLVSNSIVEGGYFGGTDVDPLFVNLAAGQLWLQPTSPAIDAGTAPHPATDIRGIPRPIGTDPDLGAYEDYIPLPNLVGLSEQEAVDAITAAGLTVGSISRSFHHSMREGYVISQVQEGSVVNLDVSRGLPAPIPASGLITLICLAACILLGSAAAIRRHAQ